MPTSAPTPALPGLARPRRRRRQRQRRRRDDQNNKKKNGGGALDDITSCCILHLGIFSLFLGFVFSDRQTIKKRSAGLSLRIRCVQANLNPIQKD
jgi:hypothetical protein